MCRALLPSALVVALSLNAAASAGEESAGHVTISVGDLEVTFVDNGPLGKEHRAGYNGIARLTHRNQRGNVFVPAYAGFNLEHIFGGDRLEDLFEPRHWPMTLRRISTTTVELHQRPTPLSAVESRIVFTVVAPHYIDVEFSCRAHKGDFFRHGYMGLFWASYINRPEDRRMHFLGLGRGDPAPRWISAFSAKHGVASTHVGLGDAGEIFFAPDFNAPLASHFSQYRFSEPFFYGRWRDMVLIYMFDPAEKIRFSQSPTGGGDKNPAWDFQFIQRDFRPNQTYGFRARVVYKVYAGRDDVLGEYRLWRRSLEGKLRPE